MAVFPNKKFRSSAQSNTIAARYRAALGRHPFALFGLPFIATMVAGSFFLTPATAVRYEKHDRRVQRLSKEDELGIGKAGRRVNMKEEYYVGSIPAFTCGRVLMMKHRDWQQKIWMIGSKSGSRDSQGSTTECYKASPRSSYYNTPTTNTRPVHNRVLLVADKLDLSKQRAVERSISRMESSTLRSISLLWSMGKSKVARTWRSKSLRSILDGIIAMRLQIRVYC
jgi:cytochrome c oxidase assembly protein subunit 16